MNNIVNEKVEDYIRRTLRKSEGLIADMEDYAREYEVPIIHKEVKDLMKVLLKMHRPKRILEIGCAIGYSSIFFCDTLDGDVEVTTTERNPVMLERAKNNIEKSGFEKNITILEGNAEETIKDVQGPFDMIFIDAAKGQYKLFFDLVIGKLRPGGIVISDNILYKAMVADDEYVVRRKKTIVKRMRSYLDYICNLENCDTSIIPIGDGVALTIKNS